MHFHEMFVGCRISYPHEEDFNGCVSYKMKVSKDLAKLLIPNYQFDNKILTIITKTEEEAEGIYNHDGIFSIWRFS